MTPSPTRYEMIHTTAGRSVGYRMHKPSGRIVFAFRVWGAIKWAGKCDGQLFANKREALSEALPW